ncbi:hypothetical protein V3F56_04515 [Moorellaceae bacterium AZ2]
MEQKPFYTKDIHFAAYLLLEGYEPEIRLPELDAKRVIFEYPNADYSTLRYLRAKFEGDKDLTVKLLDYVRTLKDLSSRVNFIKRQAWREAGQNDHNEGVGM